MRSRRVGSRRRRRRAGRRREEVVGWLWAIACFFWQVEGGRRLHDLHDLWMQELEDK